MPQANKPYGPGVKEMHISFTRVKEMRISFTRVKEMRLSCFKGI